MKDSIQNYLTFCQSVTEATDKILKDYFSKSRETHNLPELLRKVTSEIKCNEDQAAAVDQHIRQFLRMDKDYYVSRGAKGGVTLSSIRQEKLDLLKTKEAIKNQLRAEIDAKVANKKPESATNLSEVETENVEDSSVEEDELVLS
jgi:hypothetical protein